MRFIWMMLLVGCNSPLPLNSGTGTVALVQRGGAMPHWTANASFTRTVLPSVPASCVPAVGACQKIDYMCPVVFQQPADPSLVLVGAGMLTVTDGSRA